MMTACFHRDHTRLMATQKNLSNRLRAGRRRRRFSTVNCCRSTKFSKMRSWRSRKIRRSDPSASHSTLSIIGVITEFWQRPPAMLLVSKSARVVASHRHHSSKRRSHTALDIADSLERLLLRLPSWGADANSVLVRLEKQGYEAEDCDDVEMSVRDQNGKVIRCPYCGSEEDCEHTLAVIDTTWAVCEGGYSYKRFDEFGTAIEEYFLQQLRKGTRNVSGRRDRLIGELWNHAVEKYSPGGRRNLDWTLRIDGVDHRPIRGVGCKTGHIWIDHGLPGFACAYRTFYAKKPKTVFEAALAELRARLKKAKLPRKAYRKTF